ncbi:MAG: hypothetical protein ABWX74_16110 [Aeromicrobium sp.]
MLEALPGLPLPGGSIEIPRHESHITDHAVRDVHDPELTHPVWFIVTSLRCMGLTVDELCELAHAGPGDTLLYGEVDIDIVQPLRVGGAYRTTAEIVDAGRSTMRDGTLLDRVAVLVTVLGEDGPYGSVRATYLFKRGS